MATQQNLETIIDSHFFVPVGAIDIRQQTVEDTSSIYDDTTTADDTSGSTVSSVTQTPSDVVPMPPTSYQIVDQHVRIAGDGSAVVDVTLQLPDIVGVDHYDVRITKTT